MFMIRIFWFFAVHIFFRIFFHIFIIHKKGTEKLPLNPKIIFYFLGGSLHSGGQLHLSSVQVQLSPHLQLTHLQCGFEHFAILASFLLYPGRVSNNMYIIPYRGIFVKWSFYDKSCINPSHPCRRRGYFLLLNNSFPTCLTQ